MRNLLILCGLCWIFTKAVFAADDVSPGWEQSYQAGVIDHNGHYMGGSEVMHLVGHQGKLFASVGYWEDSRNILYGGKDKKTAWAQILRLDKPGGNWEVDLELGPMYVRPEILKSVTFTTDGQGKTLKEPVNLLIACAYTVTAQAMETTMFTRNDDTGKWVKSVVYSGAKQADGENRSVRAICIHRDKVTGVDRIFMSLGKLGIFSGVYDATLPGQVRWESTSESGPVEVRPLSIINSNGDLFFSAGRKVYRRNDGASPSYTVVQDMSDLYPNVAFQPTGGIRGLTSIPSLGGKGESLIFLMSEGTNARGAIYRLDPTSGGLYTRTREVCLDDLMSSYLSGNPVTYVLGAYNFFFPVIDPATRQLVHLVGFMARIKGQNFPMVRGGFYAGGMYAIRDKKGIYRLKEVNGRSTPSKPPLVAVRTFAQSPFPSCDTLYFSGNDGNFQPALNRAWIFSTSLTNALSYDHPPAPKNPEKAPALLSSKAFRTNLTINAEN